VLFFGLFFCYFSVFFFVAPPPWKWLNSAIFRYFSVAPPPENFLPTPLSVLIGKLINSIAMSSFVKGLVEIIFTALLENKI